jgi:hypothetical protein
MTRTVVISVVLFCKTIQMKISIQISPNYSSRKNKNTVIRCRFLKSNSDMHLDFKYYSPCPKTLRFERVLIFGITNIYS